MILSIQYLRAFAAILVLLAHLPYKVKQYCDYPLDWFSIGSSGVDLFFIISGFIMGYTTCKKRVRRGQFLCRRVARIIPLYWFFSTAALCIFFVVPLSIPNSRDIGCVVPSYLLLPFEGKYLIEYGWTLSYEFYFYGIFSIGLSLSSYFKFLVPACILLIAAATGILFDFTADSLYLRFATNQLLIEFVAGMSVFEISKRIRIDPSIAGPALTLALLLYSHANSSPDPLPRVIRFGIPSVLLFLGMFSLEGFFKRFESSPASRFMSAIGDSSYSLYLSHPFSLAAGATVLNLLGLPRYPIAFTACLISVAVCGGYVCYLLIERPLTQYFLRHNKAPKS